MRWLIIAMTLGCSMAWTSFAPAGEDGLGAHCPRCHETCYPTVTKGTETKSCWNVETKAICIPKVRFPWEMGCCNKGCGKDGCLPPKCGKVKYVNVLVKHEYECSACKYSFDIDGHKDASGASHKAPSYDAPADAALTPVEPPPVEARLPLSSRRVEPASFEQSGENAGVAKRYVEYLESFFR